MFSIDTVVKPLPPAMAYNVSRNLGFFFRIFTQFFGETLSQMFSFHVISRTSDQRTLFYLCRSWRHCKCTEVSWVGTGRQSSSGSLNTFEWTTPAFLLCYLSVFFKIICLLFSKYNEDSKLSASVIRVPSFVPNTTTVFWCLEWS